MADLLSHLEHALRIPADISNKLREHVPHINSYSGRSIPDLPNEVDAFSAHAPLPMELVQPPTSMSDVLAPSVDPSMDFAFELPMEAQAQLQNDLTAGWPIDIGNGLFGWLGTDASALLPWPYGNNEV